MSRSDKPLNDEIVDRICESFTVSLYIGGCITTAKAVLARRAAEEGACWSVEPTEFIYSGGREVGMAIRDINYARFPRTVDEVERRMAAVAVELMTALGQGSCSIVGPTQSRYLTRRKED